MDFKKKNPKRVRVLFKKPRPDPRPDPYKNPYKTQYPKLQKYPTIYIYSYNLTLTNPHFFNLQSSAAAAHTVRSTHTQRPHVVRSTHTQHPTQFAAPHRPTQSAAPHTVPFPYFSSVHTVRSVHTVLSPISAFFF